MIKRRLHNKLNTLLVLDEVQRIPELFAPLRSIVDQHRRNGQKQDQFLLLGSVSIELLKLIIKDIERHLSILTGAKKQVDANILRADRLRQSILKKSLFWKTGQQPMNEYNKQVSPVRK